MEHKKKKSFIVLFVILILLLAAYLSLQAWNKSQTKKKEAKASAKTVYVTDIKDISGIKYDLGKGRISFVKKDGKWYNADDKDFPLSQSYPQQMVKDFTKLKADRELKGGDSLEDYGLKSPVYTVVLTDKDGKETSLYYGNAAGDDYYVTVNDTGKVYTVSNTTISDLQHSLDEMAQLDTYPTIGSGNLKKVEITTNGSTVTYDSAKKEDSKDIAAVAGGLGAVQLKKAADYSASDKDLAGYGLDQAVRTTVKVTYTEDKKDTLLSLYIGKADNSGNRYVMMNNSRIVYLIPQDVCKNILNQK